MNLARRGDGVPLVAVHGNGVDHRLLLALDDTLDSAGGFERIYFDLPGFGGTAALDGSGALPDLAEWVVQQIPVLVGDQPFALLANSLGGLLARHVRARFPDRVLGMALLAPVVDPDRSKRTLPGLEVVESDGVLLASLDPRDRDEYTAMAARHTRETWAAFAEFALPGIRAADQDAMDRIAAGYELEALPEATAPPFTGPAVIITGRQDHVVGYVDQFRLLGHYPTATYAALDGAGHNVHLDQPEQSRALVQAWARRVLRAHES